MVKQSKRYTSAQSAIDMEKLYNIEEAVSLVKSSATAKFDETVELHVKTNADTRHAEQLVRGVVLLPHGLGKIVRVLVFAQADGAISAKDAGADFVGADDLIENIEKGWLEFDTVISTPEMMGKVGKLGRILGRKGLMPNPRTGTVVQSQDLGRAVEEAKKGKVEVKMDRTAVIHIAFGKASFEESMLVDNLNTVMDMISRSRPSAVKGQFLKSAYLTSTMGPSIALDVADLSSVKME
ncbi:MAG: 50S ribosomal protein L1 [SAR202 cluster bacterium]|nr:50S ribosomal protein L1 [Chloroflexota bacterium]MQG51693.1 50S ribosomal protein L1 [SAR202 cluster bacterium]|tara:strand:- start:12757 stop:13470 length:714 start_codon:yes stop_codon:yes gene_type:complete